MSAVPAYQQRVIDERKELDDKRFKLIEFVGGPIFVDLSAAEQGRLTRQMVYMELYSTVLAERITAFTTDAAFTTA